MRTALSTLFECVAGAMLGFVSHGCSDAVNTSDDAVILTKDRDVLPKTAASEATEEGDVPVRHPMMDKAVELGYVPLLDQKDDARGRRYAVVASAHNHGEGTVVQSELLTLETHPEERRPRPPRRIGTPRRLSEALEERLAVVAPSEMIEVSVALVRDRRDAMSRHIQRRIAEGAIKIHSDLEREQEGFIRDRTTRQSMAARPIVRHIEALGGTVSNPAPGRIFVATIAAGAIQDLANTVGVEQVDEVGEAIPGVHGGHIREGHQFNQYIDNDYDGRVVGGVDIRFAVADGQGINDEHSGWDIQSRWACTAAGCATRDPGGYPEAEEGPHMTGVASIIFGAGTSAENSGYATGARGHIYKGDGSGGGFLEIFKHIRDTSANRARVANLSVNYGSDPDCTGTTNRAKDINDTYDDGIVVFTCASNSPPQYTNDCTMSDTASAIGAFAVGATGNNTTTGDADDVRNDGLASYNPRGGTATEGMSRTMIDLVAYGGRANMFDMANDYTYVAQGCSFSTPTVTAAAIQMLDYWSVNGWGSYVSTNPGALASVLLLQGDRQGPSGKLTTQFDNQWGAGRLHSRRYDSAGLDNPWGYSFGWTCVDDGQGVDIYMNGGSPVHADVNDVKGVAHWIDRDHHEAGSDINDIDLRVTIGTSTKTSSSDWDDKERVSSFHPSTAEVIKFTIIGNDVSGNDPVCGQDSQLVHFAFLYEDGDRDDGDDSDDAARE